MGDRAAKDALYAEFAAVGKALSSPKRLELIDLLAQGPAASTILPRPLTWGSARAPPTCRHCASRGWWPPAATAPESSTPWLGTTSPPCTQPCGRWHSGTGRTQKSRAAPPLGPMTSSRLIATTWCAAPRTGRSSCWTFGPDRSTPPPTCPAPYTSHLTSSRTEYTSCPPTARSSPTAGAPTALSPTTPSGY
jgi:hypothetical protein